MGPSNLTVMSRKSSYDGDDIVASRKKPRKNTFRAKKAGRKSGEV